jgi:hypothetical protein
MSLLVCGGVGVPEAGGSDSGMVAFLGERY